MKKVVIAGSVKFHNEIDAFIKNLNEDYQVIDYPQLLDMNNFIEIYPERYKRFFSNIENCDIFIALNFDKNNIKGYIGAETFVEISYALVQNMLHNKNIQIYLLNPPEKTNQCYDEIITWINLNKIKIWNN